MFCSPNNIGAGTYLPQLQLTQKISRLRDKGITAARSQCQALSEYTAEILPATQIHAKTHEQKERPLARPLWLLALTALRAFLAYPKAETPPECSVTLLSATLVFATLAIAVSQLPTTMHYSARLALPLKTVTRLLFRWQ